MARGRHGWWSLFDILFDVLMILLDGAKAVALYSAYVDKPQNTRKSTRNYGLFLTMVLDVFLLLFDD